MYGPPLTKYEVVKTLRHSIAHFEAIGLDWEAAVIATAERHGIRPLDVIVAAPRLNDGVPVRP
jgi:hypothetical protein